MQADDSTQRRFALAALCALLFAGLAQNDCVDPDLWHELALGRETCARGAVPQVDDFAFTPTRTPVVRHEWGTGLLLWAAVLAAGGAGLLAVRYALVACLCVLAWRGARQSGAHWTTTAALAPISALLVWSGFSLLRAQLFTLVFCALLLDALRRDRAGERGWIAWWLPAHLVWLNLHAGFVVGLGWLAAHAVEQSLRRRPAVHVMAVGVAALALVLINPFGLAYPRYLARALFMPRPLIGEWAPLGDAFWPITAAFGMSLVVAAYALARRGLRETPGILLLALTAIAGLLHQRHVALYAVAWTMLVPGWLAGTPLAVELVELWRRRGARFPCAAVVLLCSTAALLDRPWRVRVPAHPGEHPQLLYPVGAVEYLRELGFEGNAITRFVDGGYVAFQLHPEVRVSIDGRYEVAYPAGSLEAAHALFAADPGWPELLARLEGDVLLAPTAGPLAEGLLAATGDTRWARAYVDDGFSVFTRPGLVLPARDARGRKLHGGFP